MRIASIMLLGLLVAPVLNGGPFFYADTVAYFQYPETAFKRVFRTEGFFGSSEGTGVVSTPTVARDLSFSTAENNIKPIYSGRSIFYGSAIYIIFSAGGFWGIILVQSVAISLSTVFTIRNLGAVGDVRDQLAIVFLVATTAVPFYAAFLMPDILAALGILAIANLFAFGRRLSKLQWIAWFLLLTVACLAHTANMPIFASGAIISVLAAARVRSWYLWVAFSIVGAIIVAIVAEISFAVAAEWLLKRPVIRPPFIVARVVADGTAVEYLKDTCPSSGYVLCAHLDKLPIEVDEFLWSRHSVYSVLTIDEKIELSQEQIPLFVQTVLYDPLGQIAATSKNIFLQATSVGLWEFSTPELWEPVLRPFFGDHFQMIRETVAFKHGFPGHVLGGIHFVVYLAAIVVLIGILSSRCARRHPEKYKFALAIIACVLANAVIVGALGTTHDRYQARVAWLVVLAALFLCVSSARLNFFRVAPPRVD